MRITRGGEICRTDVINPIEIAINIAPSTPKSTPIDCQSTSSTTGGTTLKSSPDVTRKGMMVAASTV